MHEVGAAPSSALDGEGAHDPPAPLLPPARQGPGMRPAFMVLGIAAGLVLLFGALAIATSGSQSAGGGARPTGPVHVRGTSLLAVPAARGLRPIEAPGTPPGNIIDTLTLPEGATAVPNRHSVTTTNQYDGQMTFRVRATEATVVNFYRAELATGGWRIFSTGEVTGAPGGIEVLAQKGGSDGWYWETGAVISPTTFTGAGGARQSTSFTIKLFEVPDTE